MFSSVLGIFIIDSYVLRGSLGGNDWNGRL